uniref:Uncharacterized protein n=1 Tax=Nelumbo nucifera TaxID=4432 RepID=A0A822YEH7_NELNU|nr:TPA_asm: hypothetical protein HUJ06_031369 [Nelumbo nucifera]
MITVPSYGEPDNLSSLLPLQGP